MTPRDDTGLAAADDYRSSHLQRGDQYDATLAAMPFDAYMARFEAEHLRRIVPALFPEARPRHLDFACGTGRITAVVAPWCAESIGVDISPSMLEQARRKCPGVRFVHADLTRTDVDLGRFDLVTAFRFFGNAQPELRRAVLRSVHRVLRPGGVLVLNNHRNPLALAALLNAATGGGRGGMDLHHFKLRRMLRAEGFLVEQVQPIGAWMFRTRLQNADPDDARVRALERRFGHAVFAPLAPDAVIVARKSG